MEQQGADGGADGAGEGAGGADGAGHVTSMEELPVVPGKLVPSLAYSHPPASTGHEAFWLVELLIPYEQVVMSVPMSQFSVLGHRKR